MKVLNYRKYLQSPEWKQRASAIRKRDGFCCRMCGAFEPLDVHHFHYRNIGNEKDQDLIAVCRSCHERLDEYREIDKVWRQYCRKMADYATRIYGKNWLAFPGLEVVSDEFDGYLWGNDRELYFRCVDAGFLNQS